MCQYCEFLAPDYCGSPLPNEEQRLEMTLSADLGMHVSGDVDGKWVGEFFYCNYCPMCGRDLLGDSNSDKPHYKPEETYAIFPEENCGAESILYSWDAVLDYVKDEVDAVDNNFVQIYQKVGEAHAHRTMEWV